MSNQGSTAIANELDYQIKKFSHSTYQLNQIFQQIGLPTVTLGTSGGPDSIFMIPASAFNLSQSYLNFTLTPPAAGGANNANWVFADGLAAVRQIQLYTDSGLYLADIYDVGNFTNMSFRYDIKIESLLTSDIPTGNVAAANAYGCSEGLFPSQYPAGAIIAVPTALQVARPTGWAQTLGMNSVNSGFSNYNEPCYVLSGSVNTAQPFINFKIPLGRLKGTIFGLDKTLYFGRILYLRIVWQSTNKIGYTNVGAGASNTAFNPAYSTGGAGPSQNTPTAWAGNVSITNLYLYLAKEQNMLVENELKNKVNSAEGFKLILPYVSQFKQNIPAAGINNLTLRINSATGKYLTKIRWAPYNANETICYAYDHNVFPTDVNGQNVGAQATTIQKISSFYTLVNNVRTSQFNYNVNNGQPFNTDFDIRKNKMKGGSILSQNEYYYNYMWEDAFDGNLSMTDRPYSEDQDTFIDGLDLTTGEVKYDIFVNQGGNVYQNLNYYVYIYTLRDLVVNSMGVSLA
jgi:hypothetical protein